MPAFIKSSWVIAGGSEAVGGWGRTAWRRQILSDAHVFAPRGRGVPRLMMDGPRAPGEALKAERWPLVRL